MKSDRSSPRQAGSVDDGADAFSRFTCLVNARHPGSTFREAGWRANNAASSEGKTKWVSTPSRHMRYRAYESIP